MEKKTLGKKQRKPDLFGEIAIQQNAGKGGSSRSTMHGEQAGDPGEKQGNRPTHTSRRVKIQKRTAAKTSLLPRSLFILLGLLTLYGAGTFLLVPPLIKGPVTTYLSKQLNCVVSVDKVVFSPLTLRLHLRELRLDRTELGNMQLPPTEVKGVTATVALEQLFQAKVILKNLRLDQPQLQLVRNSENQLTVFPFTNISIEKFSRPDNWPDWIGVDLLEIADGNCNVQDTYSKKKYSAEGLYLTLPSSTGRYSDLEPTFRATISGVPVKMKSFGRQGGQRGRVHKFQLQTEKVDLAQLELLDLSSSGHQIVGGTAQCLIDLLIPEKSLSWDQSELNLKCSGDDIDLVHAERMEPFVFLPDSELTVRVFPGQQEYMFDELILRDPVASVDLSSNTKNVFGIPLAVEKENGKGVTLAINKLEILGGSLQLKPFSGDVPSLWNRINLSLTQYKSTGFMEKYPDTNTETELRVQADKQGKGARARMVFNGEVRPELSVHGLLELQDLAADQVNAFLLSDSNYSLDQGVADIGVQIDWAPLQRRKTLIEGGSFTINDYSLKYSDGQLIAGKQLACTNFHTDEQVRPICGRLTLPQAEISPEFMTLLLDRQEGAHGFLPFTRISLSEGNLSIPLSPPVAGNTNPSLTMEHLALAIEDHKESSGEVEQEITLSAQVANSGKLTMQGKIQTNHPLVLETAVEGVPLKEVQDLLFPWLTLSVAKGNIRAQGVFTFPERKFQGKMQVDDFVAESDTKQIKLQWKRLTANELTLAPVKDLFSIGSVSIESPVLETPLALLDSLPQALVMQQKDTSIFSRQPLTQGIRILQGSFNGTGSRPLKLANLACNGINGNLKGNTEESLFSFSLQGRCEGARFQTRGNGNRERITAYNTQIETLSLTPFAPFVEKKFQLDSSLATASWLVQDNSAAEGRKIQVTVKGLRPFPDSKYGDLLAMLTDEQQQIRFPALVVNTAKAVGPLELFFNRMQQLQVKAALSPELVLAPSLGQLSLPRQISFNPGEGKVSAISELEDYQTLLKQRPFLQLKLSGRYATEDERFLQQILQEEENAKRDLENLKREQKRAEIEQGRGSQINWFDLPEEMLPLPFKETKVSTRQLLALARQRAMNVRDYLIEEKGFAAGRVTVESGSIDTAPGVTMQLQSMW